MKIEEFQQVIDDIYGERDRARGTGGTYMWLCEEVGELSRALRKGEQDNLDEEFADVLAWLCTLASMHGVDLEKAAQKKYGAGCPRCSSTPCDCPVPASGHPSDG